MKIESQTLEAEGLQRVAQNMCIAARTAPKADGIDNIVTMVISGEDIAVLSREIERIGKENDEGWIIRDSKNVLDAELIVLIGTKVGPINLPDCGFCGFKNCAENRKYSGVCAYNTGDLGIAIGSAVSIAADNRVDNRILFTAGKAAVNLKWLGEDVPIIYGIPLSVKGKSPFFDRK